jgi:uncharacterized protein YycO
MTRADVPKPDGERSKRSGNYERFKAMFRQKAVEAVEETNAGLVVEEEKNADAIVETPATNMFEDLKSGALTALSEVAIREVRELSEEEILAATKALKVGDILLTGDLEGLSSLAIPGPVTHSLMYVGDGWCIHADKNGVNRVSLLQVLKKANTAMIVRPKVSDQQKLAAVKFVTKQIGKAYDFEFKEGEECFYCTELMVVAYKKVGFVLDTSSKDQEMKKRVPELLQRDVIYPVSLVNAEGTKVIFQSTNIDVTEDDVTLKKT